MTGSHDLVSAIILIDAAEDGVIESTAWVQKGELADTAAKAVEVLEAQYPLEDREEEERYSATGATQWLMPVELEGCDYTPWSICDPNEHLCYEFWIVNVVCAV